MLAYSELGFPGHEFASREVGDLGNLAVNLFLSASPRGTETWKVENMLNRTVYPSIDFEKFRAEDEGFSPIIFDFPADD